MISVTLIVIYLIFHTSKTLKIFTFGESSDGTFNYATLEVPGNLQFPRKFILCTSHFETAILGTSFLTIYGEDSKPWLSLSIYESNGNMFLWTRVRTTWKRVIEVKRFWLNFWIHICVQGDKSNGNLNISINEEEPVLITAKDLDVQAPTNIKDKLVIGLSDQGDEKKKQFLGSVTNVILGEDNGSTDIRQKTGGLCLKQSSMITTSSTWRIHGKVLEKDEEDWKVCNKNESYRVAIGAPMDWNEGMDLCRNLGSGKMTELKDPRDMNFTLELFEKTDTTCTYIWTPLTDEKEEARYVNAVTGKLATFLPWKASEPNGFKDENIVLLSRKGDHGYTDNVVTKKPSCTVCDIGQQTLFKLLGVCEETYFGKANFC